MACEYFFGGNAWQWKEENEWIKYALSMMEGSAVTPFAITYRKKMTGEFGFSRSDGYDLWENFKNQIQEKLSILHRGQRALRYMEKVRYEGDIEQFLRTLENLNIEAEMSGVAWRNMIENNYLWKLEENGHTRNSTCIQNSLKQFDPAPKLKNYLKNN